MRVMHVGAEIRSINFTELLQSGVLHTKLWIVDGRDVYIGSANMDYRSLTQACSRLQMLTYLILTLPPTGVRRIATSVSVSLSVCLACLKNPHIQMS